MSQSLDLDRRNRRRKAEPEASGNSMVAEAMQVLSKGFFPALGLIFILSLALPNVFNLGSIRMSPYRFVLLIAFVPVMIGWLSGRAGRIRNYDVLMLLSVLWMVLSYLVVHGIGRGLEPAAILAIETLGAYFLARLAIRTAADHARLMRLHFIIVLILFPFAIMEARSGAPFLIQIAQKLGPTVGIVTDPGRLGMERVQATFEHSILFGVFCASAIGAVHYVLRKRGAIWYLGYIIAISATFMSISSAALMAAMLQFIGFIYHKITQMMNFKRPWLLFGLGLAAIYLAIDLLSNRTPFHVMVDYLTFNSGSAYNRILIWRFGTENVANYPLFGLGLRDWVRPAWMGASVDNFWLLIAMRSGIPAIVFLILAVILILRKVSWAELTDEGSRNCRSAYLAVLMALIFAAGTVHYWNSLWVWFFFLIGSGGYLADLGDQNTARLAEETANDADGTAPSAGQPDRRPDRGRSARVSGARSTLSGTSQLPSSAHVAPEQETRSSRFTRGKITRGPKKLPKEHGPK